MRSLFRPAATLLGLLLFVAAAFGQNVISAASSTLTSPSTLTANSFRSVVLGPGPNTITIDIAGGTSGSYTGQFALYVAYQQSSGPLRLWPSAGLNNCLSSGSTGISANATGTWSATIPGPGIAYLVATSLTPGATTDPTVWFEGGVGGVAGATGGTVGISNFPTIQGVGKSLSLLGANAGSISGSLASGAHKIQRIIGDNASGTTLYLMVFDASSLPTNGSAPIAQCMVPFGISTSPSENVRNFGEDYVPTATGVYFVWSTTSGTLTAVASATGLGLEVYGG